ncbi:restriction endonuclease subunit S [Candidatus Venteria ishoeyi]|uniref:EcoKI restriction-modification system protein HsdS n=1 Tax=Candidatus Venteria ishoeyi TaxID=1899563 RepID=A0A1H6F7P8_9GAMM|nr:restriction endonuclease subunit S [Candidatus Venteria ishoeyi]SEH04985.1 EcoKI restriction-modification system protein HsdS [Candidatus Venteria ishoeyi]
MNEINKRPRVRFVGYTDNWEKHELKNLLIERKILQKISDDAPILAFAAGQGVIDRSERKSNNRDHLTLDQVNKYYKLTEYDDIVYNPSNLKYGAIDRNKHGRGVISPIYVTFTTEEKPSFIELIVKSEKLKLRALQYEEGTVVKRQSVKPENLLSLDVNISSSLNEQTKIGNYFQQLDNLITLHQRKYDKLLNVKKAMLEKMFLKKGADMPEIRFKGFSEKWEGRKYSESFTNIPNNTFSRSELNYNFGLAKNIHYGDILIKFGELLDIEKEKVPFITNNNLANKLKPLKLQNGDVIIADAAEDKTVGKCTELINVRKEIILSGLHTIPIRPALYFSPKYLGYYMNSSAYHNQLLPLMQGTKVLSISKSAIQDTSIYFPHLKEQTKIGNLFKNLDKLLTLQQTQLKKLKNIKKACLEKMFA